MKITRKQLRRLINEAITAFQCLNHSAGYVEPNGTPHILNQERLGGGKTAGGGIFFKRGPISHGRYLKSIGLTEADTVGWLYVSNISDISIVKPQFADGTGNLEQINPKQWDTFFKSFFEPCIDAWNAKNPGREYKLHVGRQPYTLDQLFANQHVGSSLT